MKSGFAMQFEKVLISSNLKCSEIELSKAVNTFGIDYSNIRLSK